MSASPIKLSKTATITTTRPQPYYHRDVDLLQNNKKVQQLDKSIRRQFRVRSKTNVVDFSHSRDNNRPATKREIEYNKWYIQPKLRYLKKQENPKSNIRAYENEQFIYKNLHNQQYWDWEHPFDKAHKASLSEHNKVMRSDAEDVAKNKGNLKFLSEFKKKLEETRARLPLIVKQVLEKAQ